jgi:Mg/Co/Ni transporter MgtE
MERDVPRCSPSDQVADVVARTKAAGWSACVVVDQHEVVQGRVDVDGPDAVAGGSVEAAMQPGPGTVRADADRDELLERIREKQLPLVAVTTPEGRLLGAVRASG